MESEIGIMEKILPRHYVCEIRKNGIYCHSERGINDKSWDSVVSRIKDEFDFRFSEIFHQTCTNHKEFTVFLNN